MKTKKKQIVFLELWPSVMVYKIAQMFKRKGYHTISIRILESDKKTDKFYSKVFDKIISFNLNTLNIKKNLSLNKIRNLLKTALQILKIRPYVIIGRAKPSLPSAIVKIIFKKIPLIYFPYDIRALDYEEELISVPKIERKAERFCFEKSDGILHKGSKDELKYLDKGILGDNFKISSPSINFLPYCSKEFVISPKKNKVSKKDKEIHTVHIGCIGSIGEDNFGIEYCKLLAKNKVHIHLYSTSSIKDESIKDILKSGYFHLHPLFNPKEIIKEISKYDFGLCLIPKMTDEETITKSDTGNKTASYLEAGLPIISLSRNNKDIFITEFIKKYNIGFCLELKEIANLKKRKINYKNLEKNVIKARKDFLMEKHFSELENFIKKVTKKNKVSSV